jgi:hypothetical protein
MHVGILAGLIDIEGVMGMFERRNAEAPRLQYGNELNDQRRFSRTAPSREADDAPHVSRSLWRERNKMTFTRLPWITSPSSFALF